MPLFAVISQNGDILGDSFIWKKVKSETANETWRPKNGKGRPENGELRKVKTPKNVMSIIPEFIWG